MTNRLSHFFADRRGAVAILTALALIPMLLATGGAIDFGRIMVMRSELQQAVDSAALAAMAATQSGNDDGWKIKTLNSGEAWDAQRISDTALADVAKNYIEQNFNKIHGLSATTTATPDWVKGTMTVASQTSVPTFLLGLAGIYSIDIGATATATSGAAGRIKEIAIVFDTTYSMNFEGRKEAAKEAAKTFIHSVMNYNDNRTNPYVRVALVPFNNYVNVGRKSDWQFNTKIGLSWLTSTDDIIKKTEKTCWEATKREQQNCQTVSKTCTLDGETYACTEQKCEGTGKYDNIPAGCTGPTTTTISWQGCVGSRDNSSDEVDIADGNNKVPAVFSVACPASILYLQGNSIYDMGNNRFIWIAYDENIIKNYIDNLNFDQTTYIATGMLWGWRVLSPEKPVAGWYESADAAKYDAQHGITEKPGWDTYGRSKYAGYKPGLPYGEADKYIVLMTDGYSTKSASYDPEGHHEQTDSAVANAKLAKICANIKSKGIRIFTIAFMVTNQAGKSILKDCASNDSDYFDSPNATALADAFKAVGSNLTRLRLIK